MCPKRADSGILAGMSGSQKSVAGMIGVIGALHLGGWYTLIVLVAPQHLGAGARAFGIGMGITAYMLGMRHAFDADHIAAIDNTTRKLVQERRNPLSVGFWFSLGHSSIVFGLTLLLACGAKACAGAVADENSRLHTITGFIGTVISGGYLYLIAGLNLFILADIWKVYRRMRSGDCDAAAIDLQLTNRGLLARLWGNVMKLAGEPWQMYFVGLLFGLGFDTATEVALLVLTSSGAASGLPWYAILCLPVLFAAGMSLLDTIDGVVMNLAYGWASLQPMRKIYYNLVVTGLSVAVALVIGTIEILGLLGNELHFRGRFWGWISSVDLNWVGLVIAGTFVAVWIFALGIWKAGWFERKWDVALESSADSN